MTLTGQSDRRGNELREVGTPFRQSDGLVLSVLSDGTGGLFLLMQFAPGDDRLLRLDPPAAAYLAGILSAASGVRFA
jgi:hypothetical protein